MDAFEDAVTKWTTVNIVEDCLEKVSALSVEFRLTQAQTTRLLSVFAELLKNAIDHTRRLQDDLIKHVGSKL